MVRVSNAAVILLGVMASTSLSAQAPPNVVFIMTDDIGYGDIGSYGAPDVATPNLDQLARDGARFTDFYANAPVCTPTRVGFITGRYQQRLGLERPLSNGLPVGGGELASDGRGVVANGRTLPQLLRNAGYVTGLVGKWHLGYEADQSPSAHGFDYFFGFKSGFVDYYQHTNGSGADDLWEDDAQVKVEGYLTDLITDRSTTFIRENADRPFFLSVQYNAAHWPYQPPGAPSVARNNASHLQPHSQDTSTRQDYVAMLERADWGVGEILRALDEVGLRDNTLVIFTNDNGGEWLARNAPLFNRKWTVWEGGIRVPAILRWPGVIPAGRVTDQVGITMDFTATILAVANATVPDDLDLEGIDLLPILTGEAPEQSRTLFWRSESPSQRAVRSGDWKLVVDGRGSFVFDLRTDVAERHDLANIRQDVARQLRLLLDAWMADVDEEAQSAAQLQ